MLGIFLYKKNVLLLHGGSYKNIQVAIYWQTFSISQMIQCLLLYLLVWD